MSVKGRVAVVAVNFTSDLLRFRCQSGGRRSAGSVARLQLVVIYPAKRVAPTGGVAQSLILNDRRVGEHILLAALGLEPVVGPGPDAVEVSDLALPVARAAARSVPLILRTLRLG